MHVSRVINHINEWLKNNYGSKKGFVFNYYCRLLYMFNKYKKYDHQNLSSIERVIFVCKGNVCRSAYAEAFAKIQGINTISCGIDANDSASANTKAIATAIPRGIALEPHRTTPLSKVEFKENDLLLVMEPQQADIVIKLTHGKYKVGLLGLWCSPKLPYIHDPYSSSMKYFETCFNHIEKSVYAIRNKIGN